MISYPNAKINLGLNILRKREDGFHEIESVFYPIPWTDILEIVPDDSTKGTVSFASSGIEILNRGKPNLCEQVYSVMNEKYYLPSIKMHLHKTVPIGAGLGGGSADAAFAAKMLNDLFELQLSFAELEAIVSTVGSDCPFFIQNKPAFVTGRGEKLAPIKLDLTGLWMILVNPNIHIGTAEAYAGIKPRESELSLKNILEKDIACWRESVTNDFEESIFSRHPDIKEIKNVLYKAGVVYASMTGSGSTVFGLFEKPPANLNFSSTYLTKIVQL